MRTEEREWKNHGSKDHIVIHFLKGAHCTDCHQFGSGHKTNQLDGNVPNSVPYGPYSPFTHLWKEILHCSDSQLFKVIK